MIQNLKMFQFAKLLLKNIILLGVLFIYHTFLNVELHSMSLEKFKTSPFPIFLFYTEGLRVLIDCILLQINFWTDQREYFNIGSGLNSTMYKFTSLLLTIEQKMSVFEIIFGLTTIFIGNYTDYQLKLIVFIITIHFVARSIRHHFEYKDVIRQRILMEQHLKLQEEKK